MTIENIKVVMTVTVPLTVRSVLTPVLQAAVDRGWRVTLVCSTGELDLPQEVPGLRVHRIPMTRAVSPYPDLLAMREWVAFLRNERQDVVVGSTPKAATLSMLASRMCNVPTRVFLVRGARWDGMVGAKGAVFRRSDQLTALASTEVVAVSNSLAKLFVERRIVRESPTVIGSGGSKGVDVRRFHPRHGSLRRTPTLGFVGRLAADKGIDDALACFEACRELMSDVQLTVVGDIDPGQPISRETEIRLQQHGVNWIPYTHRVDEVFPTFDVLVFPSLREGLPNAVLEAAACGVPTVGYNVTGVRDAVWHGHSGLLVPFGDVESLVQACMALLRTDLGRTLGMGARVWAVERFSSNVVIGGFLDHIQDLVEAARDD